MNNELGRKLTSLTLMAIMFAGGITIAGASFMPIAEMPVAIADHDDDATTSGTLSVSSTHVMGGAVVAVTVSDPAIAAVDERLTPPSVSWGSTSLDMTQMSDGTWVSYVVDHETTTLLDEFNHPETAEATGITYGQLCPEGIGANNVNVAANRLETTSGDGDQDFDITSKVVYATVSAALHGNGFATTAGIKDSCTDSQDEEGAGRINPSVLLDPATVASNSGAGTNNTGQRNMILNSSSSLGAWPFIQAINFSSTQSVDYGSDSVTVEWGNDHDTSITIDKTIYPDNADIQLTIDDAGLNWDPTTEDIWVMDANTETLYWWTNSTNAADPGNTISTVPTTLNKIYGFDGNTNPVLSATTIGNMGCGDNCILTVGGSPKKVFSANTTGAHFAWTNVTLTETGDNTGIFTVHDTDDGTSGLKTAYDAAVDSQATLSYGGDTVTLIIGYADAVVSFDAGDAWLPVESATYSITDADLNKNPLLTETLDIGDPHDRIPTVIIGSPIHVSDYVTTGQGGTLRSSAVHGGEIGANSIVTISQTTSLTAADETYLNVIAQNTSDTSKRLRITVDGLHNQDVTTTNPDAMSNTHTWLNVTAGFPPSKLVNLEGTVALQYDITSIADALASTDIDVYVAHGAVKSSTVAINGTMSDIADGADSSGDAVIGIVSSGNTKAGVFDLDDGTGTAGTDGVVNDLADNSQVGVNGEVDMWGNAATSNVVTVIFDITHPSGATLAANDTCDIKSCYGDYAIALDFVNWDPENSTDTHNGIYRLEAQETGDNTSVFTGSVSYALLNNANATSNNGGCDSAGEGQGSTGFCYGGHDGNGNNVGDVSNNGDDITLWLSTGLDGSSAPRININDSDVTQAGSVIGIQLDTVDHTGTIEFDAVSYGSGDTANITIVDPDLNQDSEVREIYVNDSNTFQIMIDDDESQNTADVVIIETSDDSGTFVGTFVIPDKLGKDMELQYYDAVDATGGDSTTYAVASIAASDGSISLDRSSYPVPYMTNELDEGDNTTMAVSSGEVAATLTVTEPDSSSDTLTTNDTTDSFEAGNIKVKLGSTYIITAGAQFATDKAVDNLQELGPLSETEQGSGVYEIDFSIGGVGCDDDDSGSGEVCHTAQTEADQKAVPVNATTVLQVEYIDTADAAGTTTTFYDSAIFELHTATLTVDSDVYVMGQDAVLTLTDPDLNLDYDSSEQYDLRLIEWDSSANSSVLLHKSYCTDGCVLDPSNLTETGDNTGVFQTVLTIPTSITEEAGTAAEPEMGEAVTLTYRDRGISGEKSYGDDELDIEATFSISKFGAIIELDKAVYDWTDTVNITITAPDHNTNTNSKETIGTTSLPIDANTRQGKMCGGSTYTLNESSEDSGVFEGEIALTGFTHTMASSQTYTAPSSDTCSGPDSGKLRTAGNMDGITVSYEWLDGSVALASAIVQWNIGEVELLDSAVSPNGNTVIRVTDVDEDTDSTIIDTFKVDIFSDSDSGGIQATVSETGEDTGVFEASIYFSDSAATSGLTLRVSEGDTVTVEYTDVTLPGPDYTTSDDLTIAATATVGTVTPPLERAPAANARVVDAFGSSVAEVSVDQQVQIAADVANSQGKEQAFAYLVQVQDSNGVTVSLAWITGSLNSGQSMSPALSWTPTSAGSYTATVFVWESVDNPVALSPTVSVDIDVV